MNKSIVALPSAALLSALVGSGCDSNPYAALVGDYVVFEYRRAGGDSTLEGCVVAASRNSVSLEQGSGKVIVAVPEIVTALSLGTCQEVQLALQMQEVARQQAARDRQLTRDIRATILFAERSTRLPSTNREELARVIDFLKEHPEFLATIEVPYWNFVDNLEDRDRYRSRVAVLVQYLESVGVERARIVVREPIEQIERERSQFEDLGGERGKRSLTVAVKRRE